jgi:hypothetical protein
MSSSTTRFGGIRASNVLSYQSSNYRAPEAEQPDPQGSTSLITSTSADDDGYSIAPTINLFTSPTARDRAINPVDPFPDFDNADQPGARFAARDPFPDTRGQSPSADQLLSDLDDIEKTHGGYIKSSYGHGPGGEESNAKTRAAPTPMPNNTSNYRQEVPSSSSGGGGGELPASGHAAASASTSAAAVAARPSRAKVAQREAHDIKTELLKIEAERAALTEQQRVQASLNNAVQNDMNQQKEELMQLMNSVRLEKREMALRYELQEKEKEQRAREEEEKARRREDSMIEALDMLRAQNVMLATRIEERENDAYKRLEEEREARKADLQAIEEKNRLRSEEAVQAQLASEAKLAREREELHIALRTMETEKAVLADRISATEEAARQDAVLMEMQRKEFTGRAEAMNREREALALKVTENEAKAAQASEETAKQLAKEREATLLKMKQMEEERQELASNLARTEDQVPPSPALSNRPYAPWLPILHPSFIFYPNIQQEPA